MNSLGQRKTEEVEQECDSPQIWVNSGDNRLVLDFTLNPEMNERRQ